MSSEEDREFERLLAGFTAGPEESPAAGTPAAPPVPSREAGPAGGSGAKRALYSKHLQEEGYRFEVDEDGDISFRREGRWMVLFTDDRDPAYFRLALPNFYECDSEAEATFALRVANDLNKNYKVAKFVVVKERVWVVIEMFLDPLDTFRRSFERCADLLCEGAGDFRREMRRAPARPVPAPAPSPALSPSPTPAEALCDDCAAEVSATDPNNDPGSGPERSE